MKKIAIAAIIALILVGAIWVVLSRTKSGDKQEARNPKPQVTVAQEARAVSTVSNAPKQQVVASPANQTSPSVVTDAVEVIGDDVTPPKNMLTEPDFKRSRPIAINPQLLEKAGKLAAGSRLSLSLFPDAKYSVTLQFVNRSPQGDISAGGKLDGEEYGTFLLSSASGVVLARLADPEAKKLFMIKCSGQDRTEYAVEIDIDKTPVPKHIGSEAISRKQ
jgi:hypothetical protein